MHSIQRAFVLRLKQMARLGLKYILIFFTVSEVFIPDKGSAVLCNGVCQRRRGKKSLRDFLNSTLMRDVFV